METKVLELRDRATFIPLLAVALEAQIPSEVYLLRRAGYGPEGLLIGITSLEGGRRFHHLPYSWGDRTFAVAHQYIEEHWSELKSGDVVDVEYILNETLEKKTSEQFT